MGGVKCAGRPPRAKKSRGKSEVKRRYHSGVSEDEAIDREWDELWGRARMTFSDADEATYNKRVEVSLKKLKRAGLTEPPFDVRAVKRALVRYSHTLRYVMSCEEAGLSRVDMHVVLDLWPAAKSVVEFINRVRDTCYEQETPEKVARLREQLEKLATDDKGKCGASVKAVLFALERLDKKHFGDSRGAQEPAEDEERRRVGGGGGILFRIVGDAAKALEKPPPPQIAERAVVITDA